MPGIGPKTAIALLQHFGSLDAVYANLDKVADVPVRGASRLGEKLASARDAAMLSRQLAIIATDVPGAGDWSALARGAPDLAALGALYDDAGIGKALRDQADRVHRGFAHA